MEREGPYILDNNTEEHSCFTCKYFERLLFWNSLACGNKLRYVKKHSNMMYKHPKKQNKCVYWEEEE